jgi:succinyl-diaminopimelate desuccinylase
LRRERIVNPGIEDAADAVALARALVRVDTAGANEAELAAPLASRLAESGCDVQVVPLTTGRTSVIARAGRRGVRALCLTGHLDTVPLGSAPWSVDPFGGDTRDGRLWGRGSSDMKGGVAALVVAMEQHARRGSTVPVVLALCCGEETGCHGAATVAGLLGEVGAIVVGEPTANAPRLGHKGVAWAKVTATGRAAHGSAPERGENAISAMARYLTVLDAPSAQDGVLGPPTLSVGTVDGGVAVNVVADHCEAEVDVRLSGDLTVDDVMAHLRAAAEPGKSISVEPILSLPTVRTDPNDAWIERMLHEFGSGAGESGMRYFTDASVLAPRLGDPPVLVCGPGQPEQAHVVDEWCSIPAIDDAVRIYRAAIVAYGELRDGPSDAAEGDGN